MALLGSSCRDGYDNEMEVSKLKGPQHGLHFAGFLFSGHPNNAQYVHASHQDFVRTVGCVCPLDFRLDCLVEAQMRRRETRRQERVLAREDSQSLLEYGGKAMSFPIAGPR